MKWCSIKKRNIEHLLLEQKKKRSIVVSGTCGPDTSCLNRKDTDSRLYLVGILFHCVNSRTLRTYRRLDRRMDDVTDGSGGQLSGIQKSALKFGIKNSVYQTIVNEEIDAYFSTHLHEITAGLLCRMKVESSAAPLSFATRENDKHNLGSAKTMANERRDSMFAIANQVGDTQAAHDLGHEQGKLVTRTSEDAIHVPSTYTTLSFSGSASFTLGDIH